MDDATLTSPASRSVERSWPVLCPNCRQSLGVSLGQDRISALLCPAGHRFDAAKQGYVNLMSGAGTRLTPDTPEMIMSRERVQSAGVFEPVLDCLKAHLVAADEIIADCGAGTGYYLHGLLDGKPKRSGIALDLSAAGMKRASKNPQTLALVWDLWKQLPVSSGSIATVLNVFAPRHPAEYARVLKPGGQAIIVIPLPDHLAELRQHGLMSQQPAKRDRVIADMQPHLGRPESGEEVRAEVSVHPAVAADLIHMGPAGHHRTRATIEDEVESSDVARVTVAVEVMTWTKASDSAHRG